MIQVFDDFLTDHARLKESALHAGFGSWTPNKGAVGYGTFTGTCFQGEHHLALRRLAEVLQSPVIPNQCLFRITNIDTAKALVHCDSMAGDITAFLYLSEHASSDFGTLFHRHRETGLEKMPRYIDEPELFARLYRDFTNHDAWETTQLVNGKYNRMLVIDSALFHSRSPSTGYGVAETDGRMLWVMHGYLQ